MIFADYFIKNRQVDFFSCFIDKMPVRDYALMTVDD
jgi:hypothetical protein